MARCGCGGTCSCVVQGVSPVTVTGNGSVQQPYVISLSQGGQTGCAAITACVGANLGPGLRFDAATGRIQARLSTDAGNTLTFGADQGLKNLSGAGPGPTTCSKSIAGLPAAPGVTGAYALSGHLGAYSSPAQLEYCLAEQIDIIGFWCATSADDVGVVSDFQDMRLTDGRSSLYTSAYIRDMNAADVKSVYSYAGDVDDPVPFNQGDGSASLNRADRRGGWWGWLTPRYYQPLLSDFLRTINGKAVALLDCHPAATVPSGEAVQIRGAIRGILEHCAQAWAMIGVSEIPNAGTVIAAGITPVLVAPDAAPPFNTATLPYPVADVTGAGIQWMILASNYADSVFTAYRNAGINVLMWGSGRHTERTRAATLGIRGGYNMDAVYYRGPNWDGRGYDYRSQVNPWSHRRPGHGQLTYRTEDKAVTSSTGAVRGRTVASEPGLQVPAGFGGGFDRPAILMGWMCPMTNPTSYTISVDLKFDTLAASDTATAKLGLLFGAPTDAEPFAWPAGNATVNPRGYPQFPFSGYRVWQRQNGEIGIGIFQAGVFTNLATRTSPAVAADVYNNYLLTVTPTQITWTRTASGGTQYTATVANSALRGGYVWAEKVERNTGVTGNEFDGWFRNPVYTAV